MIVEKLKKKLNGFRLLVVLLFSTDVQLECIWSVSFL